MARNPRLDRLFERADCWREEAGALREILLECGLTEALKWRQPCYTDRGKNICILQWMQGFLALLFFKGGLLEDPDHLLEPQGPFSRAGYRIRFTSVPEVARLAGSIRSFVRQAIEIERAGLRVEPAAGFERPDELTARFAEDPEFEAAFRKLTPGRQRGYGMYFSSAKQSATRAARIGRYRRKILAGKGLRDR